MSLRTRSHRFFLTSVTIATVIAGAVAACNDMTTQPRPSASLGRVAVFANAGGSGATGLAVEVTGPGITKSGSAAPDTLVFNFPIVDGIASGSIEVPVGASRLITVKAFTGSIESHRGSATSDITVGTNPTLTITLVPLGGSAPFSVSLGSTIVTILRDSVVLEVGDTTRLIAQVRNENGHVTGATVKWQSLNVLRATVDTAGVVTMRDTGHVQIVASVGNVGASVNVRGSSHVSSVAYYLTWNGRANSNWDNIANWTNHGAGAARVPTTADSVVIPASAVRMPLINTCANVPVRDLEIEAGAKLEHQCGPAPGVNVSNSAVVRGITTVDVRALEGSKLGGAFAVVKVLANTVQLSDNATATRLEVTGVGSTLRLGGKQLSVRPVSGLPGGGEVVLSQGGRVILDGGLMTVASSLTAQDDSWVEMTNALDTLDVRGTMTLGTHDTRTGNLLSAGVLRLGGNFWAASRFSFSPSGTHQTILDGSNSQTIQVDSAALNLGKWQNIRILRSNDIHFYGAQAGGDSVLFTNFAVDSAPYIDMPCCRRTGITPAGGTVTVRNRWNVGLVTVAGAVVLAPKAAAVPGEQLPPTPTIEGTELRVSGVLTAGAGSNITVSTLVLRDASGTTNVAGDFNAPTLSLVGGVNAALKPGLGYRHVQLSQGSRVIVPVGTLTLGGNLTLNDSSWIEMTNAADTLSVRGNMTVGTRDTRTTPRLSAGVLRLGGNFYASSRFSFAPSGTHETIIDGATSQTIYVDSIALNLGRWQNVRLLRSNEVHFQGAQQGGDSIFFSNMTVDSAPRIDMTCCRRWGITPAGGTMTVRNRLSAGIVTVAGALVLVPKAAPVTGEPLPVTPTLDGNELRVTGVLTTGTGSSVSVSTLVLRNAAGTTNVDGNFTPNTLWISGQIAGATLKPGLPYQHVQLAQGTKVSLVPGTVTVGNHLTLNDSSFIEMLDGADTLSVRGTMTMGTKDTRAGNRISAGVLRLGGNFWANSRFSFSPTGTHETIIDGTTNQNIQVDSIALNLGKWQNVRVLRNNEVRLTWANAGSDSVLFANFAVDSAPDLIIGSYCGGRRFGITPAGGTLTVRNRLHVDCGTRLTVGGAVVVVPKDAAVVGEPAPPTPMLDGPNGELRVSGVLTTGAGSDVTLASLVLRDPSGTTNIQGGFMPGTLWIMGQNTPAVTFTLKPGLTYQHLQLTQGSRVVLVPGTVNVARDLTINDSSWVEMTNAADTLSVRGTMRMGSRDTRTGNRLSAGVLRLGGNFYASSRFSFAPSGTHETIIDGTNGQSIQVDSAALNLGRWQNVRVLRNNDVHFSGAAVGNDSILLANFAVDSAPALFMQQCCGGRRTGIIPFGGVLTIRNLLRTDWGPATVDGALELVPRAGQVIGEPSPLTPTLDGNNELRVSGPLTTGAGSRVVPASLALRDASGTSNVAGFFSPGTLWLVGGVATMLKPGLDYQHVQLARGTRVPLVPGTVTIGANLTIHDTSWIEMTNAADTLSVRGSMTMGDFDTRTGNLLSAGVLRLGGDFWASKRFSFAPSGTHQTIIDGTNSQTIRVDSTALNLGLWQNVRVLRNNDVRIMYADGSASDSIKIGNFAVDSAPGIYFGACCTNRRFGIDPASGLLTVRRRLQIDFGTLNVSGSVLLVPRLGQVPGEPTVVTPTFAGTQAIISGDLTSGAGSRIEVSSLTILGGSNLRGEFATASQVIFAGGTATPNPGTTYPNVTLKNGNRFLVPSGTVVIAGDLSVQDNSWVEMTDANDTLSVRGNLTMGSRETRTGNLLSAGVLRLGGDVLADQTSSLATSGSHETIFDGPAGRTQSISVDAGALNLGVWQNVKVAGRSDLRFLSATTDGSSDPVYFTGFALDSVGVVRFSRSHCNATPRRFHLTPASGMLMVRDQLAVDGPGCGTPTYPVALELNGDLQMPALNVVPGEVPIVPTVTGINADLTLHGTMTTGAGSIVSVPSLTLLHASGTSNIAGTLDQSAVTFAGTGQAVKAGLSYGNLILPGSANFTAGNYQFRDGRVTSTGTMNVSSGVTVSFFNYALTLDAGSQVNNDGIIKWGTYVNNGAIIAGNAPVDGRVTLANLSGLTLTAPGDNNHNYDVHSIDTRAYPNGGTLTITVSLSSGTSAGSFDLFPSGITLPTTGAATSQGSLAHLYDVAPNTSATLTYSFTSGQLFQFGAEGNWGSAQGSTNTYGYVAKFAPNP